MNPTIERLKLIFLGIFAVANVGILVWTLGWAMPEEKCVGARLGEIVTSIADRCRRARHLGYQRQSWRTSDRDGLRSWQSLQQPRLESLISVYSAPRATTMSFFAAQSARSCF